MFYLLMQNKGLIIKLLAFYKCVIEWKRNVYIQNNLF